MKMWQICADVTCSKLTLGLEQTDRKNTRPEPRFSVYTPSTVTRQLLSVCFRVSARVNMTTGARWGLEKCIMAMELSEDMNRHLPIFPRAFHFGVLKSLKKEDVQSVRSIRCCSTWQLHDEQHELSPGRPTAYLFSQTAQVYTSSVRCRNSTDEGRVKSVVLYL